MSEKNGAKNSSKAQLDFLCVNPDCGGVVKFNLMEINEKMQVLCPKCHNPYAFDSALIEKFTKLRNLIAALRESESILGDCNVAVTTPAGEVKVPYALLLTRLNTMITLMLGEKKVDFHSHH